MGSFYEACINILIGFTINWVANMTLLPMFGFHVTGTQAFNIGLLFTGVSIARQYIIRRWFNARLHAAALRMAGDR
jgi:O-antigen/teichoic acid export membrane protein